MNETRRAMGIGALTVLAVMGTGWAIERAATSAHKPGAGVVEPVKVRLAEPAAPASEPRDESAGGVPVDSSLEFDRSDLILSQG